MTYNLDVEQPLATLGLLNIKYVTSYIGIANKVRKLIIGSSGSLLTSNKKYFASDFTFLSYLSLIESAKECLFVHNVNI